MRWRCDRGSCHSHGHVSRARGVAGDLLVLGGLIMARTVQLPEALECSKKMRVPTFDREMSPRQKIDQLETYLLKSAAVQGNLTEERLDWMVRLVPLQHQWDHLPEEEWAHLRRTRTETAVKHAKRLARPELYDQMQEFGWMLKRLSEEIDRMERDASKCSRAYTMLTGS